MTKQEIIAASTATLQRKLKTASPEDMKNIIAELNARGVYGKRKRSSR